MGGKSSSEEHKEEHKAITADGQSVNNNIVINERIEIIVLLSLICLIKVLEFLYFIYRSHTRNIKKKYDKRDNTGNA